MILIPSTAFASTLGAKLTAYRLHRAVGVYRDLLHACTDNVDFERCIVDDAELALDRGRGMAAALHEVLCETVVLLMNQNGVGVAAGRRRAAALLLIDTATLSRWRST